MGSVSEYVAKVKEYQKFTDEVIAAKEKEIMALEEMLRLSDAYVASLKELLCRSIEGKLDEESQKRILTKFRN